ncbi:MAG: TVP38/TMEM64 family protein [Bacillota bacterium]|nr:TVP38/TMEM64 family protein [Bacillota bacterium]
MKSIIKLMKKYRNQIVLFLITIIIIITAYQYFNKYFYIFKDPKKIRNMIISYGKYSTFAFAFLQFIQVVIFFIPGEVVQIAGGYIFGTLEGTLISMIGITLGTMFSFSVAHYFGKPLIEKIINEKSRNYFERVFKYGKIEYVVLMLYIIPGVPKDALSYICGVTEMKFKRFFIISTIGRIPGIVISAYFGSNIGINRNGRLIFVAIAAILLFGIGVFKGDKIIKMMVKEKK